MKKVGVILCSQSKKDYACSVREMYNDSISFRAKSLFMDLFYDEWYVNTTRYGFMNPNEIIEPYEGSYIRDVSNDNKWTKQNNVVSKEDLDDWKWHLECSFLDKNEFILDCHLSLPYYNLIKEIFPYTTYIKPQINQTTTAWMYYDACIMYLENKATLEECIAFLNTKYKTNRLKETKKWFYHPTKGKFFGSGNELSKAHNIDNGGAYGVSMGTYRMLGGWVIEKDMLKYFYQTSKGKWRLSKDCPYKGRGDYRNNLPQKLDDLYEKVYSI